MGMPLLAMMYVRDGSREHEFDGSKVAHAARVCGRIGADMVKVNYSGSVESLKQSRQWCKNSCPNSRWRKNGDIRRCM